MEEENIKGLGGIWTPCGTRNMGNMKQSGIEGTMNRSRHSN